MKSKKGYRFQKMSPYETRIGRRLKHYWLLRTCRHWLQSDRRGVEDRED